MRIREIERELARVGPWPASHIDQFTRRLRGLELLPMGGRGLHAPQATVHDVAVLLLSLAAAPAPSGAHRGPQILGAMAPQAGYSFHNQPTFLDAFKLMLAKPAVARSVIRVFVSQSIAIAQVEYQTSEPTFPVPVALYEGERAEDENLHVSIQTVFLGGYLAAIARAIADPNATHIEFPSGVPQAVPQKAKGAGAKTPTP